MQSLQRCIDCINFHSETPATAAKAYAVSMADIDQYLNFCNENYPVSSSTSAAPSTTSSTTGAVFTPLPQVTGSESSSSTVSYSVSPERKYI